MAKQYKNKKAFTLVEMLTAVLIIFILAAIATPIYKKTILKARAAEAINLLESVRTKQAQNYARKKAYFSSFGDMSGSLTSSVEIRDAENSSLLNIGDYKVELRGENNCAISYYNPAHEEEPPFTFSISYLRNGLGCDGDICKHFGNVVGSVEDICADVEEMDFSCPNNFDSTTCVYPKVIGLDGCSCECSSVAKNNCLARGGTWNEENCFCEAPCEQTASPEPANNNWYWDAEACSWQCSLVPDNCGQRETYNASTCKCDCTYGTDASGNCACPPGQIWDGQVCQGCEYNSYTISGDVKGCCPEEAPIYVDGECQPCPPKHEWNPATGTCYCPNVDEQGHCVCPEATPMWNGTACIVCDYQTYQVVGDVQGCCTAEKPMVKNNECVACPASSNWNSSSKQCVCNDGFSAVYDGSVLSSCACPSGTDPSYYGPSSELTNCKCPAHTSIDNTGGAVANGPCKCPAGMSWVATDNGVDGGYCSCNNGYTNFSKSVSGGSSWNKYYFGVSCCPNGTAGYIYATSSKEEGFTGTQSSGNCWCPTGYTWQTENNSCAECPTGSSPNFTGLYSGVGTCKCPANTTINNTGGAVVEGSPCKCPQGMTWVVNNSYGTDGGYCSCDDGYTEFNRYHGSNSQKYGVACCPLGSASWRLNGIGKYKESGYNGGQVPGRNCWCSTGNSWNSETNNCSGCPSGTAPSYTGPIVENTCKCPAYTSIDNTGGAVANGPCKCPAGMSWVATDLGKEGGYCSCDNGYTEFRRVGPSSGYDYYYFGVSCCPTSSAGYIFATKTLEAGYTGDQVTGKLCYCSEGQVWVNNACQSCPEGSNPLYHGSSSGLANCKCPAYTSIDNTGGAVANGPCKCPAGMSWVATDNGVDGGYCSCNNGYTNFSNTSGGSSWNKYYFGVSCCPNGTAGYIYATKDRENAYFGDQAIGKCWCPTGQGWNSQSNSCQPCPIGSQIYYQGGSAGVGSCKCPGTSSLTNTGGQVNGGPCKCPAGMSWVQTNQQLTTTDGGYCSCDNGYTDFRNNLNGGSSWSVYYFGVACCPSGSAGYIYGSSNKEEGFTGAQSSGNCWCPAGTGPKSSSAYQGESVNATCACPTGTNWYEGSGCLKCPPGSTWDDTCGQCLCNTTDMYSAPLGVYSQTNSCTQRQFNVPGAYYSPNTCSAGCTMEAHYFDAGMNCCYCAAQAGANHDEEHDARGCLISE